MSELLVSIARVSPNTTKLYKSVAFKDTLFVYLDSLSERIQTNRSYNIPGLSPLDAIEVTLVSII